MKHLVSVVVPVYNVQMYLNRCVQSIVDQTYSNLEILLVDDGSTDESYSLMKTWKEKDPRIRLLQKTNGGLSDARNYGIQRAQGEYFAFIDSDDFIRPAMIGTLLEAMLENQAQIGVCDMEYLYDDGRVELANGGDFQVADIRTHPELIRMNNSACNKLFARSLFSDIEFPIGKWYEDLATIPMICFNAERIVKVNEPFYVYYQRTGSIAHSANPKIFHIYEAIQRVIDYIETHCSNEQLKNQFIQEMKHCYIIHGLDLTTLRIKDFDRSEDREYYLKENMKYLKQFYPNWENDIMVKSVGLKKKMIIALLKRKQWKAVLGIYDRSK